MQTVQFQHIHEIQVERSFKRSGMLLISGQMIEALREGPKHVNERMIIIRYPIKYVKMLSGSSLAKAFDVCDS